MSDLSFELSNKYFMYDKINGILLNKVTRSYHAKKGEKAGSNNLYGRSQVKLGGIMYTVSRIMWTLLTGNNPEGEIDHIDRNPRNNLPSNLRDVSRHKNMFNRDDNTSHKGVRDYGSYWKAILVVNRVYYYSKRCSTLEEALEQRTLLELREGVVS